MPTTCSVKKEAPLMATLSFLLCFLSFLLLLLPALQGSAQFHNFGQIDIAMPMAKPSEPETYLCTTMRLNSSDNLNIVAFEPKADSRIAHHIILYGCQVPGSVDEVFNCGEMERQGDPRWRRTRRRPCKSGTSILYAWAQNAPQLKLPKDVAFVVGGQSGIQWLVLQVHYASTKFVPKEGDDSGVALTTTTEVRSRRGGIHLLSTGGSIAANSLVKMEVACDLEEDLELHPFAFRVHTHGLGQVVSGWKVENGNKWSLLGKTDPQLPQMFYPVEDTNEVIRRGDTLAARCTMINDKNETVHVGPSREDEMCNFYLMYYVEGRNLLKKNTCWSPGPPNYSWAGEWDPLFNLYGGELKNVPDLEASKI